MVYEVLHILIDKFDCSNDSREFVLSKLIVAVVNSNNKDQQKSFAKRLISKFPPGDTICWDVVEPQTEQEQTQRNKASQVLKKMFCDSSITDSQSVI